MKRRLLFNIVVYINMIIFSAFLLSGCINKVDIQKLAIIMAIGVDKTEENNYEVSFQILKSGSEQQSGAGTGGGGGGTIGVLFFKGRGTTIFEAINDAGKKTSKKLHFGQVKTLIIGEVLARKGISNLSDFIARYSELRANIPVYVTKGSASEIIKTQSPEDIISANIIDDLSMSMIYNGSQPVVYMAQLIDALASKDRDPILGVIKLASKEDYESSASFIIGGLAVFEKDKLVDYLSESEARGYQFIKGKVKSGESKAKLPGGNIISIETMDSSSKIETQITGNKIRAKVKIKQRGEIMEMAGKGDPRKNPELMKMIEKAYSEATRKEVVKSLYVIQKSIKADVIGIKNKVKVQNPKEWPQVEKEWNEKFPYINIQVEVVSNIRGTGLTSKSVVK